MLPTINAKIRSIAESGLLMKWQKENSREAATNDNKGGGHGDGKQMKLRLDHVEGAVSARKCVTWLKIMLTRFIFVVHHCTDWAWYFCSCIPARAAHILAC